MNLRYLLILLSSISLVALFANCNEEGNEPFSIQVESSRNALFYSDLPNPDTVYNDNEHVTIRSLDLNGDLTMEMDIIARQDTVNNEVIRELKIAKNTSNLSFGGDIFVIVSNGEVNPFSFGNIVDFNEVDFVKIENEMVLTRSTKDLTTNEEIKEGLWNGLQEKSFIVKFDVNGEIGAWIKISVAEYDNYVLHNYASFLR